MGAALAQVNGNALPTTSWQGRTPLRLVPDLSPSASSVRRAGPQSVRLTRLGRLAITLLVATVLVGTLALAASAGIGPFGAAQPGERVVVVQSGQTLSGLADSYLPGRATGDGVAAIQIANGLSSDHVQAGQRLVIPAR